MGCPGGPWGVHPVRNSNHCAEAGLQTSLCNSDHGSEKLFREILSQRFWSVTDDEYSTVVHLHLQNCGFELGRQAIKLPADVQLSIQMYCNVHVSSPSRVQLLFSNCCSVCSSCSSSICRIGPVNQRRAQRNHDPNVPTATTPTATGV